MTTVAQQPIMCAAIAVQWCLTFAISLQLFPSSRDFFSRSSSAGVHGVLVRPFLGVGAVTGGSVVGPAADSVPPARLEDACAAGAGRMGLGVTCPLRRRFFGLCGVANGLVVSIG